MRTEHLTASSLLASVSLAGVAGASHVPGCPGGGGPVEWDDGTSA